MAVYDEDLGDSKRGQCDFQSALHKDFAGTEWKNQAFALMNRFSIDRTTTRQNVQDLNGASIQKSYLSYTGHKKG